MYANTCWGLLGLAVTFGLATLGLPSRFEWLSPWLLAAAVSCCVASLACFLWPLVRRALLSRETKQTDTFPTPTSAASLILPREANLVGKSSLFKRSWTPLPNSGDGTDTLRISIHRFYVAVENPEIGKTLRNVRVMMDAVKLGLGQHLNISCISDRTGADTIDVSPGATEYFLIGEGSDSTDVGFFHPKIMPRQEYDALRADLKRKENFGFLLHGSNGRIIPLLRSDGYLLELTGYADDLPPMKAILKINAKTQIEMFIEDGPNA
jgi:hypothetical protein